MGKEGVEAFSSIPNETRIDGHIDTVLILFKWPIEGSK
jgi:hypothetical protein